MRCFAVLLAVACSFCLAGCRSSFHRAETVLHSDGSLERAVYEPKGSVPEDVRNADAWTDAAETKWRDDAAWDGSIRDVPTVDKDGDYWRAWGKFVRPEDVPLHLQLASPTNRDDIRLRRELAQTDWLLMTEHRWSETLPDFVTLESLREARAELVALLQEYFLRALQETFVSVKGEKYDLSRLEKYLAADGVRFVTEATDLYYQLGCRNQAAGTRLNDEELIARFLPLFQKYGIPLVPDQETEPILKQFLYEKIRELIRTPEGNELTAAEGREVLGWFFPAEGSDERAAFDISSEAILNRHYEGSEAFQRRLVGLAEQIVGVHFKFLRADELFRYEMTVPGTIVETNGQWLAPNQVRWHFERSQAFPQGYTMHVRSLEPNAAAQKKLFGKLLLSEPAKLLRFQQALTHPHGAQWKAALEQSLQTGNLKPLQDYSAEASTAHANDPERHAFDQSVRKLLELNQ